MRACRTGLIGARKSSSSALPLFDAKENRLVWLMRVLDSELADQNLIVTSREDKSVRRLVGVILIMIESATMQASFPEAASVLSAYDNDRNRRLEGIEFFGITDLQVH
jgi:hypothetical protein